MRSRGAVGKSMCGPSSAPADSPAFLPARSPAASPAESSAGNSSEPANAAASVVAESERNLRRVLRRCGVGRGRIMRRNYTPTAKSLRGGYGDFFFDGRADQVAPLGPRTVVVAHVLD